MPANVARSPRNVNQVPSSAFLHTCKPVAVVPIGNVTQFQLRYTGARKPLPGLRLPVENVSPTPAPGARTTSRGCRLHVEIT